MVYTHADVGYSSISHEQSQVLQETGFDCYAGLEWEEVESSDSPVLLTVQPSVAVGQVCSQTTFSV